MSDAQYVLTFSCPNRPGIVAAVSSYLFEHGCNILDAQQFDDTQTRTFFMRVVFNRLETADAFEALRGGYSEMADRFAMKWVMRARDTRKRVMILVSKFDHCLADLLYRWRIGELPMEVVGVVANYPRETYRHLDFDSIPFHYLPVTGETKGAQEQAIMDIVEREAVDFFSRHLIGGF